MDSVSTHNGAPAVSGKMRSIHFGSQRKISIQTKRKDIERLNGLAVEDGLEQNTTRFSYFLVVLPQPAGVLWLIAYCATGPFLLWREPHSSPWKDASADGNAPQMRSFAAHKILGKGLQVKV